ncbi:tripartite tricarboxylate transporter TctB family protein [Martelella mediterranea]|uniref:Tripartite tricarboxylate transporter TctB family protein n=1 Tax=Martelella mediterranea DSM 17316 TaxID=1122214 RepID=A0A1U9Z0I7_9HYPH|nr:tripartite tricarboxylate transporter TctB family protein [Martelella mediterranea]AQZ51178.1 Tripartite tricarboxylate transporter TctB family protein [Martelella mediterranea DSM 17316]
MQKTKLNADLISGLLFIAFGLWFCGSSVYGLKIGNAFRMGPGFFPAVLGGLLALLGLVIVVNGLRSDEAPLTLANVPWRAVVLLPVALILFGAAMKPLGLAIALLLLCFCSAMAIKEMTLTKAAALSVGVTLLCIGIFSVALGLNLPLLGNWLR